MRFRVPPGRGGSDLVKVLPGEYDRLYARWYQSWEPGYDFSADNHGSGLFAGSRNYLGRSGIRPEGSDSMISTFEPLAGTDDLAARPNLYTYYRGMYQDCTDPDGACWGDHLPCMVDDGYYCEKPEHRQPGLTPKLETGRWYCIEMMVDMGTPVQSDSLADGIQNFWIDGVEYGPWTGLWHRTTPSLKLSILWLSLFHHGEHSVEGVMFDNLVVSESRIGCLGAPPPAARCTDADANEDGSVSNTEMLNYVRRWKVSAISLADLIMTISKWKNGCQ